jgi:hypothetical protein
MNDHLTEREREIRKKMELITKGTARVRKKQRARNSNDPHLNKRNR